MNRRLVQRAGDVLSAPNLKYTRLMVIDIRCVIVYFIC